MNEPAAAGESSFGAAVEAAQRGDHAGLTELFRFFHPRLLRYLRSREPQRAEDIAGETWIAVARGIGAFRGDAGAFSAWIFTIARQRLADHRRSGARRRTDPVADVPEQTVAATEHVALVELGAQHAVDVITRHLGDDQAEVVLLRVLAGLTAGEVATVMGRTENWVRVTHHRALATLRTRVAADDL